MTFDEWWSAGGSKIVHAAADRTGWAGAVRAGYDAALASSDVQADGGKSEAVAYVRETELESLKDRRIAGKGCFLNKEPRDGFVAIYTQPQSECAPREALPILRRIAHELRTYNPAADEYKGEHIHKVWAREIDTAIEQSAKEKA
jgi:hypothetical protein